MPPPLPHSIVGYVYSYDGSTAIANAIVEAQHTTTLEKQTVTAASDGYFLIECANFPSGYTAGDSIALIAFIPTREAKSNLTSVTIDANPSQSQNMTITETLRAVESCLQPAYDAHAKALKFVQLNANGSYKSTGAGGATLTTTGDFATGDNQINGSQKTQIVDGSGNVISDIAPLSISDVLYTELFEYDISNRVIYHGWAIAGSSIASAVWRIQKFTYNGDNVTNIEWANGDTGFKFIWDDRDTSYSYS
jgi:hypothetical protein